MSIVFVFFLKRALVAGVMAPDQQNNPRILVLHGLRPKKTLRSFPLGYLTMVILSIQVANFVACLPGIAPCRSSRHDFAAGEYTGVHLWVLHLTPERPYSYFTVPRDYPIRYIPRTRL